MKTRCLAALLAALWLLTASFAEEAPAPTATPEPFPTVDPGQTRFTDEPAATATPAPGQTQTDAHFNLYSVGGSFQAQTGDGTAACDVRNLPNSTHDILMRWYITESELAAHGLSAEGLTEPENGGEPRWTIVETGLFEPCFAIRSVQLLPLPDGSFLPAGVYHLLLAESYYHHYTGELFPYEPNIPITLTILE